MTPNSTEERVARFFIDHGMIHDRETGKHVSTEPVEFDEGKFDMEPMHETCALLNQLAIEALTRTDNDVSSLVEALEVCVQICGKALAKPINLSGQSPLDIATAALAKHRQSNGGAA